MQNKMAVIVAILSLSVVACGAQPLSTAVWGEVSTDGNGNATLNGKSGVQAAEIMGTDVIIRLSEPMDRFVSFVATPVGEGGSISVSHIYFEPNTDDKVQTIAFKWNSGLPVTRVIGHINPPPEDFSNTPVAFSFQGNGY